MNDKIQYIKEWIYKADHDLGSAKVIYQHLPDYYDTISFHCQQAVEKYLKALLIYKEIDFEFSHDLRYLLDLLSDTIEISPNHYNKAILLNRFGVEIRYPNIRIVMTKEELENTIHIADEFRDFCLSKMNI